MNAAMPKTGNHPLQRPQRPNGSGTGLLSQGLGVQFPLGVRVPLGFPGGTTGKESTEIWVRSLGQEDPLEEGMATHSSIPAWRIPWTEEPGGYSPYGCKESDTTEMT